MIYLILYVLLQYLLILCWFQPKKWNKKSYEKFQSWVLITYLPTNLPTDQPTPWNTVLLQNVTDPQLVKKFPAFYKT